MLLFSPFPENLVQSRTEWIKSTCPKHIGILKCEQQINTINQSNRSVVWMCDTFQLTLTEFHVVLTHLFSSDLLQLRINHWFIRSKTNLRLATFVLIIGSLFDFSFSFFHLYNIEIWFMFWIAHDFEMLIRFESSVYLLNNSKYARVLFLSKIGFSIHLEAERVCFCNCVLPLPINFYSNSFVIGIW